MSNLWTSNETTGAPTQLVIEYKIVTPQGQVQEKTASLTSTVFGTSTSTYTALPYTDRDGKRQTSEVQVRKVDRTRNTIAAVNPSYIAWRLSKGLGLPSGSAFSENITTSEYITTVEGPVLKTETSDQYVSMAQFAGGQQIEDWGNFEPSGGELVLSHRTIRRMDYAKTSDGRDVTRTLTERYINAGESAEWKSYASKRAKEIKAVLALSPNAIEPFVRSLTPLVYEGTEVQIETGRMPAPVKPPDQDVVGNEVENGIGNRPSDATPTDAYGNDDGWTKYIPEDTNWQDYVGDSTGSGEQDYLEYVPKDWEDFDTDSNDDGAEDWEEYVPQDPLDYDKDSDGDGIPDWAESTPSSWEDYDQDTDGDGEPDWAIFVPTTWQEFNRDSDNDGVPDWAPFVTGDWQTLNKDTNGDGVPDWAAFTPTSWVDFDQDSDSDGVPDWAPYVSTDWRDFNATDDQGTPLWEPFVPVGAEAFDQDTDGDGVPDWAELVPTGDDFSTEDSDYNPGG